MTDKIKITKFNVNNETFVKIDVPKSILPKNRLDREEFLKKIAKQVTQKFLDDTVEPTAADKKTEKTKKVDDKPSKARKKTEKTKTLDDKSSKARKKTEKTKTLDDKPSKARKKTEKPKTIDKKNRPE